MTTVTQDIRTAVDSITDSGSVAAKFVDPAQLTDVVGKSGNLKPLAAIAKEADDIVIQLGADTEVLKNAAEVEIGRIAHFEKELFVAGAVYAGPKIYFIHDGLGYTPLDYPYTASSLIQTDIDSGVLTIQQGLSSADLGRKGVKIPSAQDTIITFDSLAGLVSEDLGVGQIARLNFGLIEFLVVPPLTGVAGAGRYYDLDNGNQLKRVGELFLSFKKLSAALEFKFLSVGDAVSISETGAVWDVIAHDELPVGSDIFNVFNHENLLVQLSLRVELGMTTDEFTSRGYTVKNAVTDRIFLQSALDRIALQTETGGQSNISYISGEQGVPFSGMNMLDLGGRVFTIDQPIIIPEGSGFGIKNGCITVTDTFPVGENILQNSVGDLDFSLSVFVLRDVFFHGKFRANLIQLGNFLNCHITDCHGYAFDSYGVWLKGGSSSHEMRIKGGKWQKNIYIDSGSRSGAVIKVDAFDCEIEPAYVGGCDVGIVFGENEGAQWGVVSNCHIALGADVETAILVNHNSIQGFSAHDNYIDGSKIIIHNAAGAQISDNRFLNSSSDRQPDNFIELWPTSANQSLTGFVATGNKFISNGEPFEAFSINTTNGNYNSVGTASIENNTASGNIILRQLTARMSQFFVNESTLDYDFSDALLLTPNFIQSSFNNVSTEGAPFINCFIDGTNVMVDVNANITGVVALEVRVI